MASRTKRPARPQLRDDDLPMDVELDGFDDDLDDDDVDRFAFERDAARPAPGRGRARNLPHDWADFDYGHGGFDADWR